MRAVFTHTALCLFPLVGTFSHCGKSKDGTRQYCIGFYSIMQESSVATEYYKPNGIKHLQRFFPYYSIIL
jgi:hypothetical protein